MRKKIAGTCRQLFLFFIYAICFLLPFEPKFLATIEILTVLFFFLGYSPLHIYNNLKKTRFTIPFFLFFLVIVISYFFSQDTVEAGRQLEVKLPFFVITLLLVGAGLNKQQAQTAICTFIAGCAAVCPILLGWAIYDYIQTDNAQVFVYSQFSRFMHVSYFSMYLLFCFAWLFMMAVDNKVRYPQLHYFLMVLFAVCLLMASAKITLLAFIISAFIFAGYFFWRKKNWVWALAIASVIIVSPIVLYLASPNVKSRVNGIFNEYKQDKSKVNPNYVGSTAIRMIIWEDAVPQIMENLPWGIGVGDVQQMLTENYQKRGLNIAVKKNYNMHNEYLQQLAGSGIAGFILYLIMILIPALVCRPPYRFIGIMFSFSLAFVSLTESILERQAGTIFICLLGILLMIAYGKENKPVPNS